MCLIAGSWWTQAIYNHVAEELSASSFAVLMMTTLPLYRHMLNSAGCLHGYNRALCGYHAIHLHFNSGSNGLCSFQCLLMLQSLPRVIMRSKICDSCTIGFRAVRRSVFPRINITKKLRQIYKGNNSIKMFLCINSFSEYL